MKPTAETDAFYAAFRAKTPTAPDSYDVVALGDSSEMQNELMALVLAGTKRATAGLARDFDAPPPSLPKVGDHVVALDGEGCPAASGARSRWR